MSTSERPDLDAILSDHAKLCIACAASGSPCRSAQAAIYALALEVERDRYKRLAASIRDALVSFERAVMDYGTPEVWETDPADDLFDLLASPDVAGLAQGKKP